MRILVTGAAGFIGSHVAETLVKRGDTVIGLDNLNDYYDPARKVANLGEVRRSTHSKRAGSRPPVELRSGLSRKFTFVEGDIRDTDLISHLFGEYRFGAVVHLAAMAGVRASIHDPALYYDVNLNGTLVLLEAAVGRLNSSLQSATSNSQPNFVFASTSSVYGNTDQIPFTESDPCNGPLAPYPASKKAAELLGHSYHHLYDLNFTAVRFFTVYGPRGRPDMMAHKVLDNIFFDREVPVYNDGQMHRDWTYVDDIVAGVIGAVDHPQGYDVVNLGRGEPVLLADFIRLVEENAGRPSNLTPKPMPAADIPYTYADVSHARELLGYDPQISVEEGVKRFWQWYRRVVLEAG